MESRDHMGWRVLSASQAGVAHRLDGTPCQDAYCWRLLNDTTLVVAVSDGAGSASLSEIGSATAVEAVISFLESTSSEIDDELLEQAFFAAINAINLKAEESQAPLREFACTLTVIVVFDKGFIQGSIGDSAAIVCTDGGGYLSLIPQQKGEYVNETCFLTSNRGPNDLQIARSEERLRGVIAATDGLMDFLLRGNEPCVRLVKPLFDFAAQCENAGDGNNELNEFLRSESITSKISDDVSLVLTWREIAAEL